MLGRLRMPIQRCLDYYKIIGEAIFGNSAWFSWSLHSHEKLHTAIQKVVFEATGDGDSPMHPEQPDIKDVKTSVVLIHYYMHNLTSSSAVLSFGKANSVDEDDRVYWFRNYTIPVTRIGDRLDGPKPCPIWKACRATTAAPHYFDEIKIDGRLFMDAAIEYNNPSRITWDELLLPPTSFVSIGTGKSIRRTPFNSGKGYLESIRLIRYSFSRLTDTEKVHDTMTLLTKAKEPVTSYFRFNVQEGLEKVRLNEWKKPNRWRSGTIGELEEKTTGYLNNQMVLEDMRKCAVILVWLHRQKMDIHSIVDEAVKRRNGHLGEDKVAV